MFFFFFSSFSVIGKMNNPMYFFPLEAEKGQRVELKFPWQQVMSLTRISVICLTIWMIKPACFNKVPHTGHLAREVLQLSGLTALWSYKRWHSVGEEWEVFSSLDGAIKWCEEKKKVSFCFLGSNLETDKQNFKRHKISWRKDHCENVFSLLGERFEFQDFLF